MEKEYQCVKCLQLFSTRFQPRNPDEPFCSRLCANSSRKKKPIACIGCGALTSNPKYCTRRCQRDAQNEQFIQNWLKNGANSISSHDTGCIRKYITQQQGNACTICTTPPVWNNQPLGLILDHIDGNYKNNFRQNLRCICPNCDSQLPTSKGRNRSNGRHWRRMRYAQGKSH